MAGWKVYTLCILSALGLELFLTINTISIRDLALTVLNAVLDQDSIFATELFAGAIFRIILGIMVSFVIIAPILLRKVSIKPVSEYIGIRVFPMIILFAVFLYLNASSENSDKLFYAVLSFTSLIVMLAREHFIFYTQEWFARTGKDVLLGAIVALVIFILLHPLVFTPGRVMGTLLMINLWIYTVSERNLWMGIAIHAAWNFVLPQSAEFHYFLFAYSCVLAFGRLNYPAYLIVLMESLPLPLRRLSHSIWIVCSWPRKFFVSVTLREVAEGRVKLPPPD